MAIEDYAEIILNSMDEGIVELDRDYKILSTNRFLLNLMKTTNEKVIGKTCYELFHNLQEVCPDCPVTVTFETGESASTSHEGVAFNGSKTYVELNSYPIKDSDGNVVKVIETVKDLSERRNLEEAIMEKRSLEKISKYAVDRELKMVELKKEIEKRDKEIKKLKIRLKQEAR